MDSLSLLPMEMAVSKLRVGMRWPATRAVSLRAWSRIALLAHASGIIDRRGLVKQLRIRLANLRMGSQR